MRESLRLREDNIAKLIFSQWVGVAQSFPTDANFRSLLVRAISEGWDRPMAFLPAMLAILKHEGGTAECIRRATHAWPHLLRAADLYGSPGLAALAEDQLLSCLLQAGANIDIEIERFLTAARRALLEAATDPLPEAHDDTLRFYSLLAAQCFINEYVFIESDEEAAQVSVLRNSVDTALKNGALIGAVVGLAMGFVTAGISDCPGYEPGGSCGGFRAATFITSVGMYAAMGTGIDALVRGRSTIYAAPPVARTRASQFDALEPRAALKVGFSW